MPAVCFYFQVHQPYRVKRYSVFNVGKDHDYYRSLEDRHSNEKIFHKVAKKCYLPTNKLILELLKKHPDFRVAYSLSGVFLEQAEEFSRDVVKSFQDLVNTGQVELLEETYYHSLAFLYSKNEFKTQISLHRKKIEELFGVSPKVFRNTELIFNNDVAREVELLGYKGIIAEGADHILDWRNPNFVYRPKGTEKIKLLLKNYRLSDDIAFRFSTPGWEGYPVKADKFANWVSAINGNGHLVNLFMDYETFGEHQWEDTGIFEFLRHLPAEILKNPDNSFVTPSEAIRKYSDFGELDFPHFVSWADTERDLSAWHSNSIQKDALKNLYALEQKVLNSGDEKLIHDWRRLQTSDHFYYMCTKWFADGDVHKYFNPYETPYEAFINFMNILGDVKHRIKKSSKKSAKSVGKKTTSKAKNKPVASKAKS